MKIFKQKNELHLDLTSNILQYLFIICLFVYSYPSITPSYFLMDFKVSSRHPYIFPLNISACISLIRKFQWNHPGFWVYWLQCSSQLLESTLTSASDLEWKGSLIYKVDHIKSPRISVVVPTCWVRHALDKVIRVTLLHESTHLPYCQVG